MNKFLMLLGQAMIAGSAALVLCLVFGLLVGWVIDAINPVFVNWQVILRIAVLVAVATFTTVLALQINKNYE